MATKSVTFQSKDLGEDTKLLLCFVSPTPDLFVRRFPIAWKVATLSGKGFSSFTATYVNAPSFCVAQVDPKSKIVTTGNYVPMQAGQETTLHAEQNVRPPVFYFSDPTSIGGDIIKVTNASGQTVDMGVGFISNLDHPSETVDTTTVIRDVTNGSTVNGDFAPVIRAYVGLDIKENEILGKQIQHYQPVWQADVLNLEKHTTVIITREDVGTKPKPEVPAPAPAPVHKVVIPEIKAEGKKPEVQVKFGAAIVPEQKPVAAPVVKPEVKVEEQRAFGAVLAFSNHETVVPGVKEIAEHLIAKHYDVKFTHTVSTNPLQPPSLIDGSVRLQSESTNATLDLNLPHGVSLKNAEEELIAIITKLPPIFKEKPQITSRYGSKKISSGKNFTYWVTVNAASKDWEFAPKQAEVKAKTVPSSSGNFLSPMNGVPHTKNRPLSRKSSAVNLNGSVA
ncbi:hypothetical protein NLI96_g6080 [Meripilus lineatus]|uniref:Uncharacterized protein n=1 Tax=Meripilus lineatus TaxID=2056292 RepID=A0AAD5V6Y1_9APHY|nr:hypothetical protein NLI96_g6080 [Physisporinus lineatus]